jgi:uncharacterized protein (TIGR03086 family)
MTAAPVPEALEGAVELLERALAYTRVMLADVGPHNLEAPTPCSGWTLARLLSHMDDALDAFTEAAAGRVHVEPVSPTDDRVEGLRDKACALLGAWTQARPAAVDVGDQRLDGPLLVATAALEVAVHGWDVAQATGRGTPIPDDLARGLLPIAEQVVGPDDRGSRFAAPRPVSAPTTPSATLMAFLGRMTGPVGCNRGDPPSRGEIAS